MSVAWFCGKGNLGEEYEEEAGLLLSRVLMEEGAEDIQNQTLRSDGIARGTCWAPTPACPPEPGSHLRW